MNLPNIPKYDKGGKNSSPAKGAGIEPLPKVTPMKMPGAQVQNQAQMPSVSTYEGLSTNSMQDHIKDGGGFADSDFVKSGAMSAVSNVAGSALQNMGSLFGAEPPGADTGVAGQKALSSAAKQFGPWGQVAGLAMDAMMGLENALGVTQNTISEDQAERAGVSGAAKALNNLTANIPGFGLITAALSGGKKTIDAEKGMNVEKVRNAYSGSLADMDAAEESSGKNYLFGRKKMNEFIEEMNRKNRILEDISTTNTLRKQSSYGQDLAQQNLNRYSGQNYSDLRVGKEGMKLPSKEDVRILLQKYKSGGKMNLIPAGALHAHRHHLEDIDEKYEDVTKKGIPVVTEDGQQLAEIERNEVILTLALTKKLEELEKDGSDEAAIEAGKLLAKELILNIEDKTGLLKEIE